MNGETQLILQRLTAIETKQDERHNENQKYMKVLNNLPCEKITERIKWIDRWLVVVCVIIGVIFGVISKVHGWW